MLGLPCGVALRARVWENANMPDFKCHAGVSLRCWCNHRFKATTKSPWPCQFANLKMMMTSTATTTMTMMIMTTRTMMMVVMMMMVMVMLMVMLLMVILTLMMMMMMMMIMIMMVMVTMTVTTMLLVHYQICYTVVQLILSAESQS